LNIKLHSHPASTFARRVRIYMAERNLDFPLEYVAMERLAHKRKEYVEMNPYGKVPVLEVDDKFLYESLAIIDFLENTFDENSMLPKNAFLRAQTRMLCGICDTEFANNVTPYFFAKRFLSEDKWDIHGFGKVLKRLKRHFKILSNQLGDKEYMIDGKFGLVEICYAPYLEFHHFLDITMPQNIVSWHNNFKKRKSVEETKPQQ